MTTRFHFCRGQNEWISNSTSLFACMAREGKTLSLRDDWTPGVRFFFFFFGSSAGMFVSVRTALTSQEFYVR